MCRLNNIHYEVDATFVAEMIKIAVFAKTLKEKVNVQLGKEIQKNNCSI